MFAERRRFGKRSGARRAQPDVNEEAERPRRSRGRRKLVISRLSQRVGKRKAGRKERVADIESRSVTLPPTAGGTAPFPVRFVHVSEIMAGARPAAPENPAILSRLSGMPGGNQEIGTPPARQEL